jgi:hypothetical protein
LPEAGHDKYAKECGVLENSPGLTMSNATALSLAQPGEREDDRLAFGSCLMIWLGMGAATWSGIALVTALF